MYLLIQALTSEKVHFTKFRSRKSIWNVCKIAAILFHYSDVKWPPKHLNSPASRLFVQQFAQSDIKGITKVLHHWPFVKGIHQWPVDSPPKGSVMWKVFPLHKVIMLSLDMIKYCHLVEVNLPQWLERATGCWCEHLYPLEWHFPVGAVQYTRPEKEAHRLKLTDWLN